MTTDKEAQLEETFRKIQENTLAGELEAMDESKHSVDYSRWAARLIHNGYRKLPKDKPPLLEQKNCHEVNNPGDWNMGASEQRDADIRHYEGK